MPNKRAKAKEFEGLSFPVFVLLAALVWSLGQHWDLLWGRPQDLRITTYNLQNLFDAKDNPRTRDEEFLPLKSKRKLPFQEVCGPDYRPSCRYRNWTEAHLINKTQRIAEVLNFERWRHHEILIFNEVENREVLDLLLGHYRLGDWKTVLWLPDRDPRGIASAIVSTLPTTDLRGTASPAAIGRLHFPSAGYRGRGILEASLMAPNKKVLSVFAFHFPSQRASAEDRKEILGFLSSLIQKRESSGAWVVAGGDSNMKPEEERTWLSKKGLQVFEGNLSHHWSCSSCEGTYLWNKEWNFFDWIYLTPSWRRTSAREPLARLTNDIASQKAEDGSPLGFRSPRQPGVSDHFPVSVYIDFPGAL